MSTSSEANFKINVTGNAADATKDIASASRLAAKTIDVFEGNIKSLSADLRRLTGNSEEVISTKKKLKEQIDRAKSSVSLLTVELQKQGTSYAEAAMAAKKYDAATGNAGGGVKETLAKLAGAVGKGASPLGKGLAKAFAPLGKGIAKVAGPAAKKLKETFAPAVKKVATALAPAGKALLRFGSGAKRAFSVVASAARPVVDALPSMSSLVSVLGTVAAGATAAVLALGAAVIGGGVALAAFGLAAADAYQKLNRQRQALLGNAADAGRLGDQIQALANRVPQGVDELNALGVSLAKTRLTGKAMVDTMNAVAQASGAVDASAGAKLQEIITRGDVSGRMFLGLRELQGTGIDFDDVAREYAAGTKKSIEAARAELMSGAVPIERGAEALRKATEKKFGELNIKNAFSLENAPKKFFEQFKSLTSGVNLEPITKGLQDAFAQLSPDAPLGRAVQTFMTAFGSGIAEIAGQSIPVLLEGFKWLVVGALRVGAQFYEMKKQISDALQGDDWPALGKAIVMGIAGGITGAWQFLIEAVGGMASTIKDTFTGKMKIGSPSKVFEEYGVNTTEGYAQGVDRGAKRAEAAVGGMVSTPEGGGGGGGGASGPISVTVNIDASGGGKGGAEALTSPVFMADLTRALRLALVAKGAA